MDIGEEELETLEEINPHWRAQRWLQVAAQGIRDEEVPWHKLLAPLTSGAEGMAKALAKCLVAAWQWNVKVQGEGMCLPAPSVLNIGQFLTDEEVEGGMGEPHWFMAYSHMLQRVGEVTHGRKWEVRREALEIKASPLVHAFWCKVDVNLMMASVKHCWEPAPRTLHHQRENGPTAHVISYLNELVVRIPTREAWDQMVWPQQRFHMYPLKPSLTATVGAKWWILAPSCQLQNSVLQKKGGPSCALHNPTLNEAKWVPTHGLANDLSWAKERSAVALANYVPHTQEEAKRIARLEAG